MEFLPCWGCGSEQIAWEFTVSDEVRPYRRDRTVKPFCRSCVWRIDFALGLVTA